MNNLRAKCNSAIYILLLHAIAFPAQITAQMSTEDSAFYRASVNNAVGVYHAAIGDASALLTGPQYADCPKFRDGANAFFNAIIPSNCTIVYDNVFYPRVNLLFDEITGVVVVQNGLHRIQLQTDKVAHFTIWDAQFVHFTIWDAQFVHFTKDSLRDSPMPQGFYQILYDQKVGLLKQEVKQIEEDIRSASEGIIRSIKVKKYYYVRKGNAYFAVTSKADVLKIFDDRQKDIAQYLKRHKLDFGKNGDEELIKLLRFYEN